MSKLYSIKNKGDLRALSLLKKKGVGMCVRDSKEFLLRDFVERVASTNNGYAGAAKKILNELYPDVYEKAELNHVYEQ